jgi:hypothetical protein
MKYKAILLSTLALLLACAVAGAPYSLAAEGLGFVDSKPFIEIAGEDGVMVEVNLSGSLLKTIINIDPSLKELAGGLESIHAVVMALNGSGRAERARETILKIEKDLRNHSWQRLALVRENDGEVRVLTLSDGEGIQGLVVMVIDMEEGEMVFANIAGNLDLAAISKIGDGLGIPGIEDLELGTGTDE